MTTATDNSVDDRVDHQVATTDKMIGALKRDFPLMTDAAKKKRAAQALDGHCNTLVDLLADYRRETKGGKRS